MQKFSKELPPDRADWTFGDLVYWHFFVFGTRPDIPPDAKTGRKWEYDYVCAPLGITARTFRNWMRDTSVPRSTTEIEQILFGENSDHDLARAELGEAFRQALLRAKRGAAEPEEDDSLALTRSDASDVVGQTLDDTPVAQLAFVPPPEMPSFSGEIVGRDDVLTRLGDLLLEKGARTQRVAVRGLGGVGKTSVALEYMRRFGPRYHGTWWCRSETRTALLSSLANLGRKLQQSGEVEADVEKAAKSALAMLAAKQERWLLVYDNVPAPDHIHDLLPHAGAEVLITSRFAYWSQWATEIELEVFSTDVAASLLQQLASRTDVEGARLLADLLGKLPLAIEHAAAFCKRSGLSFAGYAHKISDLIKILPAGGSYPQSVHATFSIAIDAAIQKAPATEFLMTFLSHCAAERIPMAFVDLALHRASDIYLAIATLTEVSLIKHDPYSDGVAAISVHRLVQEVGRSRAKGTARAQSAVDLVATCLSTSFPADAWNEPDAWDVCEQLLPHVFAIKNAEVRPIVNSWASLLERVGAYFYGRGNIKEAASFGVEATVLTEQRFGKGSPEVAGRLQNLASSLLAAGDLDGALRQVQQALVIQKAHNLQRAVLLSLHGSILRHSGKREEAKRVTEEALQMAIATEGDDTPPVATIMNDLAIILDELDDMPASIKLDKAALAIREQKLGPNHVEVAQSLHNLALSYVRLEEFEEALTLITRAAEIKQHKFGPDHPETLLTEANRADILARNGRFEEAESLCAATVNLARDRLGATDHRTVLYEVMWSDILLELDRPGDALPLSSAALNLLEKANAPLSRRAARVTMVSLRNLGLLKEAEELGRRYKF